MRSFCPLRQAPKMGFCPLRLPFSGIPFWTSPAVFDDHYMSYIIYILLVENLHLWMIFPLKTSSSGIHKNLPKSHGTAPE